MGLGFGQSNKALYSNSSIECKAHKDLPVPLSSDKDLLRQ